MNNVERYLRNELTSVEIVQFENDLQNDIELRKELNSQAAILASFDHLRRENIISRFDNSNSKIQKISTSNVTAYWRYAAAIAGIVLIGSAYFFNKSVDLQQLSDSYYTPYPNVVAPAVRSEGQGANVWEAYNAGQYASAYDQLVEAHNVDPNDISLSFYLGITAIETKKYDEAINLFKALQVGDHKFSDQSNWFLAMAYLKSNQKEPAIKALTTIVESKSSYSEKAEQILSELE